MSKIIQSKAGRIGLFAGCATLGLATTALIGRGIGAICDKVKNNKAAKEADKAAQ